MATEFHMPHDARIIKVPFSEVAMHIGIAGKVVYAAKAGPGDGVQLYDPEVRGKHYSAPITSSEAGWDMQEIAEAGFDGRNERHTQRWTAFVKYPYGEGADDYSIEELDFDCVPGTTQSDLIDFCKGVLALDYDPGFTEIKVEQRFGMYM